MSEAFCLTEQSKQELKNLRIESSKAYCELIRAILLELNGEGHDEDAVNNAVDRVIDRLK